MNEAETRAELIDPALRGAGWGVVGVLLATLVATWGPWFMYQERTIFTFYTIVMVPFTVLALTYALGLLWGRRTAASQPPAVGTTAAEAPAAAPAQKPAQKPADKPV